MKFIDKKAFMPPLGLITVAAMLPGNWNLRLVDMNVTSLTDKDLEWAELVMISAMIVQKDSFAEVVKRAGINGAKVAAGGPYPTTSHHSIEGVDYFILNEAESTLCKFIDDFENGTAQHIYSSNDKPGLSSTPPPRFDLIDINAYSSMALQTSRGCPFNCEFCDIIEMFGRRPRYKEPARLVEEMQALYDTGYRGALFIVDDNFIGNKSKVKALLQEMILWQMVHEFPFGLYTEASIDLSGDEELLDMMVDAGFDTVFIGIETPDTDILENTSKVQNTRSDLLESVKTIQSKGLEVMAGFILGFDNEKPDIFERQIRFISEAAIPAAMIGLLIALPETRLFRRLSAEGRILNDTSGNNTHQFEMNFIPTMEPEKLVSGYKHVLKSLYNPSTYFKRSYEMLKRVPTIRHHNRPLTPSDIRTLIKSLSRQSLSRYGFNYLSYITKTLLFHPEQIYRGISLAVKGDHFIRITREITSLDRTRQKTNKVILSFEKKLGALKNRKGDDRLIAAAVQYKNDSIGKLKAYLGRQPESIRTHASVYFDEAFRKIDRMLEHFMIQLPEN